MTDAKDPRDLAALLAAAADAQAEATKRLDEARAREADRPISGDPALLTTVAEVITAIARQTDTRGVLERMAGAARRMMPAAGCIVLLRAPEGGGANLAAYWDADALWIEGANRPQTMPDALERISRGDTTPTLQLDLAGAGVAVGEFRVWLGDDSTQEADTASAHIVAEAAGLALAGLTLQTNARHRSVREPLTGLFNRRYLEDTLQREIHRCKRVKRPLGLIQLDLDGLSAFNLEHGRTAGDRLLQAVGGLLQSSFRGSDAACRIDDDTFVVVMPDADLNDTRLRAEHLCDQIAALEVPLGQQIIQGVPASVGVAGYPDLAITADELMLAADSAVQLARGAGGNTVEIAQRAG
ncbi:GGDEF domain-containing protein [Aquisalimonas asiatica]|uniref:diguanylate cyclase n=1 Tax=Aquisalimonas asiatica TaxID=406100 RepID=A0A1H8SRK3_9GAMM|nr:GGDEF domain-containing protein [Aquisalimonas asiatica]SEO80783.1 diguanylate cyclase (GGDEF) domain-containing protein [Aquisalimonas asiatica]